ncbi:MAG: hypothetical protein M3N98_08985 [Actinomycetota bacterium]|nr:hypothetical protein [Actinomycetota bacterium]
MTIVATAAGVTNRQLAHFTALIGIPLSVLALVVLVLVDLHIVRGRRPRLILIGSSVAVTAIALGYIFWRFTALKS